jgi:ribosomal protein S27AE
MPRNKIDRKKVLTCLEAVCPKCQHVITPAQVQRVDFERMKCPACGEVFVPTKHTSSQ